jgi:hypothetical protein
LRNPGPSPSLSRFVTAQPSPVMTSSMPALYVRALACVLAAAALGVVRYADGKARTFTG